MQDVEFEEDPDFKGLSTQIEKAKTEKKSFTLRMLEEIGVTDKTTASLILLAISVVFFGISIVLYADLMSQ